MSSSGLILSLSLAGVRAGVSPVTDLLPVALDLGVAAPVAAGVTAPPGVMPPKQSADSADHVTVYNFSKHFLGIFELGA